VGLADVRSAGDLFWDPWNSRQVFVAMVDDGYKWRRDPPGLMSCRNVEEILQPSSGKLHHAAILFCAGMRVASRLWSATTT